MSGAEWMEAVRAKELAEAKAKKKSIPKQDDEKFDALGNKIESQTTAAEVDRDLIKKMTKQLKVRGPRGGGRLRDDADRPVMRRGGAAAAASSEESRRRRGCRVL